MSDITKLNLRGTQYDFGGGAIELFETTETAQSVTDPFGNVTTKDMPDLSNLPKKNGMFIIKVTTQISDAEIVTFSLCSQSYIESYDASVCVFTPFSANAAGNYIAQISNGTTSWLEYQSMTLNSYKSYTYTNNTGSTLSITIPSGAWTSMVYKNGMRLLWGPDVTRNNAVLTFATPLVATDNILVEFFGS